ncbi:hypothetical protein G6F57_012212 [Rhizopus arrhizus]|nr:hypothetical protein G6F57_012212 [Rhizopus arrhizus]
MTKALPEEARTALINDIALERLGSPEDIAHAVAFLAGPAAGYITGETLHVNGRAGFHYTIPRPSPLMATTFEPQLHLERDPMSTIEERVKKIVVEQLGVKEEEVTNSASFVDDLGADSLDTVELVMALEEEFECEIPDEEAEKISTVQAAIDYVKAHVKA